MSDKEASRRPSGRDADSRASAAGDGRRPFDAATVTQRWWEGKPDAAGSVPAAAPGASGRSSAPMPPPPPPPPPGWGAMASPAGLQRPPGPSQADLDGARIQRLEQELAAAREETTALHEMLEDLPEIFERKFRQRLHGILEQQQLLLADNRLLRDQLYALQPAAAGSDRRLLPPGDASATGQAAELPNPPPAEAVVSAEMAVGGDPAVGGDQAVGADPVVAGDPAVAGEPLPPGMGAPGEAPGTEAPSTGDEDGGPTLSGGGGRRRGLQRVMRRVLRLGRRLRSGPGDAGRHGDDGALALSDRDDGMPTAA